MKAIISCNDTAHSGPTSHPMSHTSHEWSEADLRDALANHTASRMNDNTIWLRGPEYPGVAVHGVPSEIMASLFPTV